MQVNLIITVIKYNQLTLADNGSILLLRFCY